MPGPHPQNCTFLARRGFSRGPSASAAGHPAHRRGGALRGLAQRPLPRLGTGARHPLPLLLRQLRRRRPARGRPQHPRGARPLSAGRHHRHGAAALARAHRGPRAAGRQRRLLAGLRRPGPSRRCAALQPPHRLLGVPRPAPRSRGLGGRRGRVRRLARGARGVRRRGRSRRPRAHAEGHSPPHRTSLPAGAHRRHRRRASPPPGGRGGPGLRRAHAGGDAPGPLPRALRGRGGSHPGRGGDDPALPAAHHPGGGRGAPT